MINFIYLVIGVVIGSFLNFIYNKYQERQIIIDEKLNKIENFYKNYEKEK